MGSWLEKIKSFFSVSDQEQGNANTVFIDIPTSIYVKELAIYTAISLIANAISQSEILCYVGGKREKNEDYYSLNVKPNPNESASQFWHKVVEKMFRNPEGALCFISNRHLYCADSFGLREKRPFLGHLYDGVVVDDFCMSRVFTAQNCFLFKLENTQASKLIDGVYRDLASVITVAMESYKDTNAVKYVFRVDGIQAGDKKFNEEFEKFLKKGIEKFVKNESKVLIQYNGRTLESMKNEASQKNSDDITKLFHEVFSFTGKAFKIPESLMTGNINNMEEVVNAFLTFAVDPVADEIGKTLTGAYGFEEWKRGRYYRVDTSTVGHVDIFKMADKIDKLISSSFACIDEVRVKAGMDELNEEWSKKHLLTKNYEFIEKLLREIGGGEGAKNEPT